MLCSGSSTLWRAVYRGGVVPDVPKQSRRDEADATPDADYLTRLSDAFDDVVAQVIAFPNPLQGRPATNTVYLATAPG